MVLNKKADRTLLHSPLVIFRSMFIRGFLIQNSQENGQKSTQNYVQAMKLPASIQQYLAIKTTYYLDQSTFRTSPLLRSYSIQTSPLLRPYNIQTSPLLGSPRLRTRQLITMEVGFLYTELLSTTTVFNPASKWCHVS